MLPTQARFRGDKLFSLVYRKGWRINSNSFVAYYYKADNWRVAVVVSKKIANKANVRNTIRRRFFASIRLLIKNISYQPGYVIFVINKKAVGLDYANINKELEEFLQKSLQLKNKINYDKRNFSKNNRVVSKNSVT